MATNAPEPAGFGNCRECAYVGTGTASICFGCASETIEEVAPQRCMTCDGHLAEQGRCGNPLCNDSPVSRGWDYIYAVAMRSGPLKETIERYKYGNHKGWAGIFGRVLVGYLEEGMRAEDWDLIIPMPTTSGLTLREVAHKLKRAGAKDVAGVVLARQPFGS